jgi:hypothetical protein
MEDRSMRRIGIALVAVLALGPGLWADGPPKEKAKEAPKPATPAEQYRALTERFTKAQQEFFTEYQKAKTEEERNKLFQEKYPQPATYAGKMMAIAEKYPKDPAAVDALVWVVTSVRQGPQVDKAMELLVKDHVDSPKLGTAAAMLVYFGSNQTEKWLQTILNKNPHKDVQAMACLSLGQYLKRRVGDPNVAAVERERLTREAEAYFERAAKDFPGVKYYRRNVAEMAKGELFELRNLAIGKTAPEINGEDTEGKKFKLSDYRGKVVVLDFWGNW